MEQLMELIEYGVTPFHVIDYMKKKLVMESGYQECNLNEQLVLEETGRYYVNLYDTNACAFRIGKNITKQPVIRIAMAHSDYPCFQIKPNPTVKGEHAMKFNVEIYGGINQKAWFDRPLGVAGRIVTKGEDAFSPSTLLYKSAYPMCVIPSLAIHMDRELNKKGVVDVAKELVPIVALEPDIDMMDVITKELAIDGDDVLDYELFLYNMDQPRICGVDASMIASPRLDNLTSVAALMDGLLSCDKVPDNTIDMCVVFDNEEVGSLSKQGADSQLLSLLLDKVAQALQLPFTYKAEVAKKSFLLSVDVAHGNHPNYEEKSDVTNKAYLGKGFSLKRSVGQKYGTTASSSAVVKAISQKRDIPYTIAINKTGIPGGSTLGPIVTSHLPFPCADIGMPILAMHSAVELGAGNDYQALKQFVRAFYEE